MKKPNLQLALILYVLKQHQHIMHTLQRTTQRTARTHSTQAQHAGPI